MTQDPVTCPSCAGATQRCVLDDVELDVCPHCGGTWFDLGELGEVLGADPYGIRAEGLTSRTCPRCDLRLKPFVLAGDVDVDKCSRCEGIFLDAGELETLGSTGPQLDGPQAPAPGGAEFVCVKCGLRTPLRHGNALASGLACDACTPQVQTTAAERARANSGDPGGRRTKVLMFGALLRIGGLLSR